MELKKSIDIGEALQTFNSDYWQYVTDSGSYPMVIDIVPKITKLWRLSDGHNYVWVDGNDETKALERYIAVLDGITRRTTGKLPQNLLKMIARVYMRYRLNYELVTSFDEKDGIGHAAYNRVRNSMRFVPEFFRRFGVLRFGKKLVPEFHKTCVHEYGHMLWYHFLTKTERAKFMDVCPKFINTREDIPGYWRPEITTMSGQTAPSQFVIADGTVYISEQELVNHKECFAESFAMYVMDPAHFEEKLPERSKYFQEVIDTDYKLLSANEVKKATVEVDGKKSELTDLIPIDLQTTDRRIQLATALEAKIRSVLKEMNIPFNNIEQVVATGEYSSNEEMPTELKAVLLVKHFPRIFNSSKTSVESVKFRITGDESLFNEIVFKELELNERRIEREESKVQKFTRLRPDQIERWVTTKTGRRMPIPKKGVRVQRSHKSQLVESKPVKAAQAPKAKVGVLKPSRPIVTSYVVQEHYAERAGRHFDFRIKVGGKALSWVLPKGLPKIGQKRLALSQPTHSAKSMKFAGKISSGYGKGVVQIKEAGPIEIKKFSDKSITFDIMSGSNAGTYIMNNTGKGWLIQRAKKKEFGGQFKLKDYRMRSKKKMLTSKRYVVKPRIGGPKVALYIGENENRILSRTVSTGNDRQGYAEKTDNFPHIRDLDLGSSGTVLEVELFVHSPIISNALLNSNAHRSRTIQNKAGKPIFFVHDILSVEGEDARQLPYHTRMKMLAKLIPNTPYMRKVPGHIRNKKKVIKELFERGNHGVYIIDRKAAYGDSAGLYLSNDTVGGGEPRDSIGEITDSKDIVITSSNKKLKI